MRYRENRLIITPLRSGSFRLSGYFMGERVRFQHRESSVVEAKKLEYEQKLVAASERTQTLRLTWLTDSQLRDAEAAVLRAGGRTLLDCVEASDRVMVVGDPVLLTTARTEFVADLKKLRRFDRTIQKNATRAQQFIDYLPKSVTTVQDVLPDHVKDFVFRDDEDSAADYTRLTDAQVLRAWMNFWIAKRWVKVSPFEINMRDFGERARPKSKPKIATPEQAIALLRAAMQHTSKDHTGKPVIGRLVPYVILSTWCFLRHGEAVRCTLDWLKLDAKTPVIEVDPRKRGTPSYRTVTIPANVLPLLRDSVRRGIIPKQQPKKRGSQEMVDGTVPWSKETWLTVRAHAGIITLGKIKNGRRPIVEGEWPEHYLRHTGISYFNQSLAEKSHRGEFNEKSVIAEVCRQAGNSDDTAFRHYLNLPAEGAADSFYGPISPPSGGE